MSVSAPVFEKLVLPGEFACYEGDGNLRTRCLLGSTLLYMFHLERKVVVLANVDGYTSVPALFERIDSVLRERFLLPLLELDPAKRKGAEFAASLFLPGEPFTDAEGQLRMKCPEDSLVQQRCLETALQGLGVNFHPEEDENWVSVVDEHRTVDLGLGVVDAADKDCKLITTASPDFVVWQGGLSRLVATDAQVVRLELRYGRAMTVFAKDFPPGSTFVPKETQRTPEEFRAEVAKVAAFVREINGGSGLQTFKALAERELGPPPVDTASR